MHMQCIPTPVAQSDRLYTLGGRNHTTLALRLDGAKGDLTQTHVEWTVRSGTANIPSPVCEGELYYYVEDNGFGNCLKAATGECVWRERLGGNKYQASLVGGDGK